jgi:7-carboxy-7-deazaguanine synthase
MSNLRISEIFVSIQGEGIFTGVPSIFVRTSGCNLRCRWCDTPYASWNPEGPVRAVPDLIEEVAVIGDQFGVRHIVLTGGEPMLFDGIVPLAEGLSARGHHLTIETAGTVFRELPCDLMSISPKLANSTPDASSGWAERHDATRADLSPLRVLIARYPYQLKFVVGDSLDADLAEIEALLKQLPTVVPDRVLLMPEGTDVETLRRRQKRLVEPCIQRGWRLSPRLHVELFGNKRGT